VKVVGHQAIAQYIAIREQVVTHLFQEKQVVLILEKYLLAIVALVINVKNSIFAEVHVMYYFCSEAVTWSHRLTIQFKFSKAKQK
jgi:hypothetical protein